MKKYNTIAVVHDIFTEDGGAERVLRAIIRQFPTADVYIPVLSDTARNELKLQTSGNITSSWFNTLIQKNPSSIIWKPLFYLYFEQLDLSLYDLVISSSHMFSSKSVITGSQTRHVSYIHTSPRYLYAEYNEVQIIKRPIFRILLSPFLSWLRVRDYIGAQRPDMLVANSKTVQARIKKYYHRDSTVIYPPIQIPKVKLQRKPEYFLCMSRLSRQKGIDLAILACNKLQERLIVVGKGAQEQYLRSIAGPTIEFLGNVPDEAMIDVWSHAKALIYPSIEEDFGMITAEALAHGVPVIGHDSGGTREIIATDKVGVLFTKWTPEAVVDAIQKFKHSHFDIYECRRQATKYSSKQFINMFYSVL